MKYVDLVHFLKSKIVIPKEMINWRVMRASGPGGQNVNKSNSKVELYYFKKKGCSALKGLPPTLFTALPPLISIKSEKHREQERNKEECLAKLALLLKDYAVRCSEPRPKSAEEVERFTKMQEKGKALLKECKIRSSSIKAGRKRVQEE